MTIAGMVKTSFLDYPGLVACVLFVPGCNYNCFYCHNRSLIDGTHEIVIPGCVDDFLVRRSGMLDGAVVSGGEPTLQPGLLSYLEKLKSLRYKVKLDTNGSTPQTVKEISNLSLCDYFAVDYKAPMSRYAEICGPQADAAQVLKTVAVIADAGIPFEVRTTVIPQLDREDLIKMAQELPKLHRYVLNRYRKPEKYLRCHEEKVEQTPYSQSQLEALADAVRPYQPNVVV